MAKMGARWMPDDFWDLVKKNPNVPQEKLIEQYIADKKQTNVKKTSAQQDG